VTMWHAAGGVLEAGREHQFRSRRSLRCRLSTQGGRQHPDTAVIARSCRGRRSPQRGHASKGIVQDRRELLILSLSREVPPPRETRTDGQTDAEQS
jgi:hypothetical protein